MKKPLLLALLLFLAVCARSQKSSNGYVRAMQQQVDGIDTLHTAADWVARAHAFEHIAQAEPQEWLPLYYAAFCYTQAFNFEDDGKRQKHYCEQAEHFISRAEALQPNHSEITLLKSMAASLRLRLSPLLNGARYGRLADELLNKAQQLDPNNPRVYVHRASQLYFTPAIWGGDKQKAREMVEKAEQKYKTFRPASSLHPDWGRTTLRYLRSQMAQEKE